MNTLSHLYMTINNRTLPPCTSCGACCRLTPPLKSSSYADLSAADVKRLPAKYKLRVIRQYGHPGLATARDRQRCVALRGTIGRRVRCDIYPQRPYVCRRFKRGDAGCLRALREIGFFK